MNAPVVSCASAGNLMGMGSILSGCNPPRVQITLVKVAKLTFKSDHAVMKDNNTDWKDSGSPFSKPEWIFGQKSKPVSYTKNTKVTVEVVFDVYPRDAGSTACTVKGKAQFGSLEFSVTGNIKGGAAETFTATSSGNLPDKVSSLTGDIAWSVDTTDDGLFDAGASWGHTVYVTLGTPVSAPGREQGITQKRMETAIRVVGNVNSNDSHTIIQGLLNTFQSYTLNDKQPPRGVTPVPLGPWTFGHCKYFNDIGGAWPLIDYVAETAQCQAIVRFVRAAAKQVGCPGDMKIMLVYASPLVDGGNTVVEEEFETVGGEDGFGGLNGNPGDMDPVKQNHPKKTVNGKACEAWLLDRPGGVVGVVFEAFGPDGGNPPPMGPNNYEACLKFTDGGVTKYYGGGMPNSSFATKEVVLSSAFPALAWLSYPPAPTGRNFIKVEKIIKSSPW